MYKFLDLLTDKQIYFLTSILSIILSLWFFASEDIVGRDAILYLEVAQGFLNDGMSGAYKIWAWPFYSIFIALIHIITGLSLEHSAHFLTLLMELAISLTFLKLYTKISIDGSRLWVAMLFIISFAFFNEYKGGIFRGYGFWAFTLIAIYQFIVYFQSGNKLNAILWQVAIVIAILFRPEGIVYAVLAPLYLIYSPHYSLTEGIRKILILNSIFLGGLVFLLISLLASDQLYQYLLNHLPTQAEYFSPEFLFYNFNLAVDNFSKYVLPFGYSVSYSPLILASGLLVMLIYKIIKNLSLIYLAIWLRGIFKQWFNLKAESYIIHYFIAISLLILVIFISNRLFVSSRYLVFIVLLMGLVFTQYLDYLIKLLSQKRSQKNKLLFALLMLFVGLSFLDAIISIGAKKTPIKQASLWLKEKISVDAKIACNEERFVYYTQQKCLINIDDNDASKNLLQGSYSDDDLKYLKNNGYTYMILWIKHKNSTMITALEQDTQLKLLKRLENKKKDLALIFKIR